MDWVKTVEAAIQYIETHLTEELPIRRIASEVNISPFYFQKGFSMLCGYTVGEYIRRRRLSLAGSEWLSSDIKVVDLALKYGYDSPDAFTRAFTRFHGSTPTEVRSGRASLKSFAPLHIRLSLEGGTTMEYRIEKKPAFRVIGVSRMFSYESAHEEIPRYWDEVLVDMKAKRLSLMGVEMGERPFVGRYGICFEEEMAGNQFRYMIADDFLEDALLEKENSRRAESEKAENGKGDNRKGDNGKGENGKDDNGKGDNGNGSDRKENSIEESDTKKGNPGMNSSELENLNMIQEIPAHTWAVFPCKGPMPSAVQEINRRIFSEWLPAGQYEIAEGYNVEYYSDAADYENGTQDEEYDTEVWIPVKRQGHGKNAG